MEQKLYFSDTSALTSEIENDITEKELNHATQNFVESLTKGYQKKKESDPNFFLSNKVLQKRFPLNLKLIPEEPMPRQRSDSDHMEKSFSIAQK